MTFDTVNPPVVLTGGDWNQAGTNYSAGNPDFVKLKLNPEKFKISSAFSYFPDAFAVVPYDFTTPSIGAVDIQITGSSTTAKSVSYFQTVAVQPS